MINPKRQNKISIEDRIITMMFASAIADAMAGPWEGRQTHISQEFLEDGGWINEFKSYTPGFQHHWNVYSREAAAGTFTDDTRLRLLIIEAMVKFHQVYPDKLMTKEFLASYIFSQYKIAVDDFQKIWKTCKQNPTDKCKESFLQMWMLWEISKTATEVFIPADSPLYSPPAKRMAESEYTTKPWSIQEVAAEKISQNIKSSFHHNCYMQGEEMPLGLIAILPLCIYFTGNPAEAFHYVLEMDFFDIKDAPLYPAVFCAILADLLNGKSWSKILNEIKGNQLNKYVNYKDNNKLQRLQDNINDAIAISREFKDRQNFADRENYIKFIKALHKRFAVGEIMMCTVDEMLGAAIALMDFGSDLNIKDIIEMGVNYGRDNDTVASLVGCLAGAASGENNLPNEWKNLNSQVNQVDFQLIAKQLSKLKSKFIF